ncbi:general substrate transporter [Lichtheimia hyalospora FSU 10163]|nr:general substrate transporter [Lichtheimia hyalospora FSU 10163]
MPFSLFSQPSSYTPVQQRDANDATLDPLNDETSNLIVPEEQLPLNDIATTKFVYVLVFSTCIGGFLFGYDTGIISGALQPLQEEYGLVTMQKEFIVGGTTFAAIFGGLGAGMSVDRIGRKSLVLFASVVFIVGAIILGLANGYSTLLIGRLVVGFGVGIASMIVPMYIGEVAPRTLRGRLSTINTLMVTFGQVVAYLINIAFAKVEGGWRYMFGLAALPAIIQCLALAFVPESPRYLIANGETLQAQIILRKVYGEQVSEAFIDQEVYTIQDSIKQESEGISFSELFNQVNRRPLFIACLLQAAQQLSGFNTAMYYAATIMQMAGFRDHGDSTSVALIVASTNMIFTAVAIKTIDRIGRRRLLVSTMFIMILGLLALGSSFASLQGFMPKQETCESYGSNCARCVLDERCGWLTFGDTCSIIKDHEQDLYQSPTGCPPEFHGPIVSMSLLVSLFVYVASYALGLGYAPWLIQSELFSMQVRGKANGLATAVNWTCNLIIATTFLSLADALSTAVTFWLYAAISFAFWILVVRMVPETKGKSLEDIQSLFHQ